MIKKNALPGNDVSSLEGIKEKEKTKNNCIETRAKPKEYFLN